MFLSRVTAVCRGEPPAGKRIVACLQTLPDGSLRMVLPNPCAFAEDERFARLACHELAHVNGWTGQHEE